MSRHPGISSLVVYGSEAEQILLPVMSVAVGERMRKTAETMNTMDMEGETVFAELKRRSTDFSYHDEKIKREGWLMPSCKIMRGWEELSKGKRVVFFYFWREDKTLWMYELKEGDFTKTPHFVPKNHYDQMLHVAIPQDRWTFVATIENQFEEERCLLSE